jgi:lipopolysaccharide cholinephosphotransferase
METIETEMTFTCPYGKDTLKKVQEILWDMYCEMSDIFDKHGIRYFLIQGTLLGAMRHEGFVPWDDDLDVCIIKDDYDKALQVLRENLSSQYIVHDKLNDPNYFTDDFSKIRHLGSEMWFPQYEAHALLAYRGMSIDLLRVWKENVFNYKLHYKYLSKKKAFYFSFSRIFIEKKFSLRNVLSFCYRLSMFFFSSILNCFFKKREVYIRDPLYIAYPPMEIEWIFPLTTSVFNGRLCPVPYNSDAVLTRHYGDWRKYIDEAKRIPFASKVVIFDKQ